MPPSPPVPPPNRPLPPLPDHPPAYHLRVSTVPRLMPYRRPAVEPTTSLPLPDLPIARPPHSAQNRYTYPLSRRQEVELEYWRGPGYAHRDDERSWAPRSSSPRKVYQGSPSTGPYGYAFAHGITPGQMVASPTSAGPSSVAMVRSESLPVLTNAELELVGGSRGWAQAWARRIAHPVVSPVDEAEEGIAHHRSAGTPSPDRLLARDDDAHALFVRRGQSVPFLQPQVTYYSGQMPLVEEDERASTPTSNASTPTMATYNRPSSPSTPTPRTLSRGQFTHPDDQLFASFSSQVLPHHRKGASVSYCHLVETDLWSPNARYDRAKSVPSTPRLE